VLPKERAAHVAGTLGTSLIVFGGVSRGKYISADCYVLETDKAKVKKMQEEDRKQEERDRAQQNLHATLKKNRGEPESPGVKKGAKQK